MAVPTQAIAQSNSDLEKAQAIAQTNSDTTQNQAKIPTQSIAQINNPPMPPNKYPGFVHDPIFWLIIALAFLFRVILDRPNADKK